MSKGIRSGMLLLLAMAGAAGGAENLDPQQIRYDPFSEPERISVAVDLVVDEALLGPVLLEAWRPQLRAVLLSGTQSLANIDGKSIAIGEEIAGHRLLSVTARAAVLIHDGKRLTISMDEQDAAQ